MTDTERFAKYKEMAKMSKMHFKQANTVLKAALKSCRVAERYAQKVQKVAVLLAKKQVKFPGFVSIQDSLNNKIMTVNDLLDYFHEEPELLKF